MRATGFGPGYRSLHPRANAPGPAMTIDCHAHLLPPDRMAKLIRWILRFNPSHPVLESITREALLDEIYREFAAFGVPREVKHRLLGLTAGQVTERAQSGRPAG